MRFKISLFYTLFTSISLVGQNQRLTNGAIWNFEFSQETLASIHPLNSESAYTVIEVDYPSTVKNCNV